jgi:hypothetical protein
MEQAGQRLRLVVQQTRRKTMSAGNFVAVLAMAIVVWSAFAFLGESWETPQAHLVTYTAPEAELAARPQEPPILPDRMLVGSITPRPEQ